MENSFEGSRIGFKERVFERFRKSHALLKTIYEVDIRKVRREAMLESC